MPDAKPATYSYDEVPYESHPYAQTHPSRLFTVATLFGLKPPPIENCRVLELGCAGGGNIIPMAERFPNAWFVGIDLSARQISDGEKLVHTLDLKNVSLRHASIVDVDESYGKFDYIICHGVFSWVPTAVRDKIFDIYAKHLTPNGVAYVSYNTYPGWHMRGMIRDMMRYHALRFATPSQRTEQARALLDFLATSVRQEGPYSVLLKSELEGLRHQADHYLYHEHLEEVNDPLYFHQFVEMATKHGLRYLGESRIGTMVTGNFAPEVEKALQKLATTQIQVEQYMDFLRNRTFRETLLVAAETEPDWSIAPERIAGLHLASSGKPVGDKQPDLTNDEPAQYKTRTGMTLSTGKPILKAAMQVLGEAWPATLPFDEVRKKSRELIGGEANEVEDAKGLASGLLNSYISSDLVELFAAPITATTEIGERPKALGSARVRALNGVTALANNRHELVRLSDLDQKLVPLLDGSRDRLALVGQLAQFAMIGDLNVQRDNQKLADPADIQEALAAVLGPALTNLASQGLLV
jgi:methyltransferase-like protein/SAM-dependent methyltransferase